MSTTVLLAVDDRDARTSIKANPDRDWTSVSVITLSAPRGSGQRPYVLYVTPLVRLDPSHSTNLDKLLWTILAPGGEVIELAV